MPTPRAAERPNGGKVCGKTSIGNGSFYFLLLTHFKSLNQIKVNSINGCGFLQLLMPVRGGQSAR